MAQVAYSWWLRCFDHTNAIVTSMTTGFLLYTRSAGVAYFAGTAVLCSLSVKVVKRFVRQPRPFTTVRGKVKKSYGMPSTHSATITYFATYITLACLYLPIHPSLPSGNITRILPPLIAIPAASTIAVSRIWLGHHTWLQVVAGCAFGLLYTPVTFTLWVNGLNEYGRVVEQALFG